MVSQYKNKSKLTIKLQEKKYKFLLYYFEEEILLFGKKQKQDNATNIKNKKLNQ